MSPSAPDARRPPLPVAGCPDAWHGVVLPPPTRRWDGRRLVVPWTLDDAALALAAAQARTMPGVVDLVVRGTFVGLVATTAAHARQAADWLALPWQAVGEPAGATGTTDPAPAADPTTSRTYRLSARPLPGTGAVTSVLAPVVAWVRDDHAAVWADGIDVDACRAELSRLLDGEMRDIDVHAGHGPSGAEWVTRAWAEAADPLALARLDAASTAALLSAAVRHPVAVAIDLRWTDAALTIRIDDEAIGGAGAPRWQADVPWAVRPTLARQLAAPGRAPANASPIAVTPTTPDAGGPPPATTSRPVPPIDADAWRLAAAEIFARESWLDERWRDAGRDPIAERLASTDDPRARTLLERVVARGPNAPPALAPSPVGRGAAVARVDGEFGTVWSAWLAEVAVDPRTGQIALTNLTVGHDAHRQQPAREAGRVSRAADRLESDDDERAAPALPFPPAPDAGVDAAPTSRWLAIGRRWLAPSTPYDDWGIADTASDAVAQAGGTVQSGSLALDGVLTLPAAAAIANAIHDATGVRLREAPFDAAALARAARGAAPMSADGSARATLDEPSRRTGWRRWTGAVAAGAAALGGAIAMAWPVKPAIAPVSSIDLSVYSADALARGQRIAIAGDCAVCHTAPGGATNAGGLALQTPFGRIVTTNITPDVETGIGAWSYAAFDRAMRQGVHRDGRQLYPAFPYTAYARLSEADMQALYGHLMSQPAVSHRPAPTALRFPFDQRWLMAGWNLLFHDDQPFRPDPARDACWNRGAYLVEGIGHCGACHTPRNALGAERRAPDAVLAGGEVDGWWAPALNRLADAPVPWQADELVAYLRTGFSARHGVAAGPMAPVVHGLAQLPESDVQAIVAYLLGDAPAAATARPVTSATANAAAPAPAATNATDAIPVALATPALIAGERIYDSACAVCHEAGRGPTLFGVKPSLAMNTGLHADTPDNLVQVILHGIQEPANGDLGYMPGFRDSLDDTQIGELIAYLRARFAPGRPAWSDTADRLARLRAAGPAHGGGTSTRAGPPPTDQTVR